jgi:hypothetical protein
MRRLEKRFAGHACLPLQKAGKEATGQLAGVAKKAGFASGAPKRSMPYLPHSMGRIFGID